VLGGSDGEASTLERSGVGAGGSDDTAGAVVSGTVVVVVVGAVIVSPILLGGRTSVGSGCDSTVDGSVGMPFGVAGSVSCRWSWRR